MNRPRKKNKQLPECMYQKHGAYWHVKRGKWTRLGTELRDSLAAYASIYEAPKGGMGGVIAQALAQLQPSLKRSTARQYALAGRKLATMLAEFSPGQVQPKHIAGIKLALAKTPNMANRVLSVARQVFDYALEQQLCEINPAASIKRHKEAKRKRILTAAEREAIYGRAGERLQVIIDLLCLTGQRVNDVLKIRRADLTDDGIRFRQEKTDATLIVRWTPELRAVTERARSLHGNIRALTLLHNRRGKAPGYRTIHLQWALACKAAGVEDAHIHDLRAVSASQTKREGKNPTALLGHTSAAQTVRYLREHEEPVVDGPSFRRLIDNKPE